MRRAPTWIPLVWTLALAAAATLFHRLRTGALSPPSPLALLAELGFWALYCAVARWLWRRSAWSLLLTGPLLLALLALAATQEAHRALFGSAFDPDGLRLARSNWELVTTGVLDFLAGLPPALVLAAVAAVVAFGIALARSGGPVYRSPLRGGVAYAAASMVFAAWWLVPALAGPAPGAPAMGALALVRDLRAALAPAAPDSSGDRETPGAWKPQRSGVRAVSAPPSGPRPDIVLVLLESVRADHLSVYGYARDTTPRLRALAARPGTWLFPRAFTNSTLSYIALISLLSGYDARRPAEALADSALIWDQLAARGYQSCFVTISLGYWRYRLDRFLATPGLGSYRDLGQEQLAAVPRTPPRGMRERFLRAVLGDAGFRSLRIDRDDGRGLAALRECVEARDPARPLLAVWELEGTHFPYRAPEAAPWAPASSYALSRRDSRPLENAYDNAILAADRRIGELLDWLDASGRAEQTLLVVTSDHGEAFWEHGQVFHGKGFHPEQVWVPFLMRIPAPLQRRLPPAALAALSANRDRAVQLVDLAPTLAALADGSTATADPATSDGVNLLAPLPAEREIHLSSRSPFVLVREPSDYAVVRDGALEIRYRDGRIERFELAGFAPQPAAEAAPAPAGGNTRMPANSQ